MTGRNLEALKASSATGRGRRLPAVQVRLVDEAKRARYSTQTDDKGHFAFLNVQVGRYELVAALAGFTDVNLPVTVKGSGTESVSLVMYAVRAAEVPSDRGRLAGVAAGQRASTGASENAAGRDRCATHSVRKRGACARPSSIPRACAPANRAPFNTEGYDKIDDHQWTDATRKPLSTFSIDVDTASYANVRRFLNTGQLPPKDAVRIEELVNYFSYDYPQPHGDDPFSITTALGPSPWHPGYRLALVGLQARRMTSDSLPPRNLVFLIDVSGSMMQPNKLPLVKASLAMLAQNLTVRDHVAIVVYAGAAGLVLPPTRGDDSSSILEALGRLEAGGSTNGAGGLLLAYRTAAAHFVKGGVNRVILATDGDFNVGVTSQGDLIRLVEEHGPAASRSRSSASAWAT